MATAIGQRLQHAGIRARRRSSGDLAETGRRHHALRHVVPADSVVVLPTAVGLLRPCESGLVAALYRLAAESSVVRRRHVADEARRQVLSRNSKNQGTKFQNRPITWLLEFGSWFFVLQFIS